MNPTRALSALMMLSLCLSGTALAQAQQKPATGPNAQKAAAPKQERQKHPSEAMDYGPFISSSLMSKLPQGNDTVKAITIKVGNNASVCFDTELLRYSSAWVGGFIDYNGVSFKGNHGGHPGIAGVQQWGTRPIPGWGREGSFVDPRPVWGAKDKTPYGPYGHLPREWGRYSGLYISGERTVLSYSVGLTAVLDMPGTQVEGEQLAFTRTIRMEPSTVASELLVCENDDGGGRGAITAGVGDAENPGDAAEGDAGRTFAVLTETGAKRSTVVGVVNAPAGATWKVVADGQVKGVHLKLPASASAVQFELVYLTVPAGQTGRIKAFTQKKVEAVDLRTYTKGGPARWTSEIEVKGELGKDSDAPYVVDTIPPPFGNPWKSWIRFGGLDFFPDGKSAALCTWSGDVWVVSGIDEKLEKVKWKRFATGIYEGLGLRIVDGAVYVLGKDQITKLSDLNGDGEADFYENFNNDVIATAAFHEFTFDLQTDPQGNFYFSKAGPVNSGGRGFERILPHHGTLLKVAKDGSGIEVFATGLRAPNGIGVGPNGEVTSGDNEGTWMPMCRLNLVEKGSFNGCTDTSHRDPRPTMYDPPICFMPKYVDNSGGGQVFVTSDKWGPFKGNMLHTSYGTASLYNVMYEKGGGTIQGGVVKFPVGFASGIMRPRFNPGDGQLYVAGLKGWQTNGAVDACFQRVRYTGRPVVMANGLKFGRETITLKFTGKFDAESVKDLENWDVEWWNYKWCSDYGSAEYSVEDPTRQVKQHETVELKSAKLLEDGQSVELSTQVLRPVMQIKITAKLKDASGKALWAGGKGGAVEIYGTINKVPEK